MPVSDSVRAHILASKFPAMDLALRYGLTVSAVLAIRAGQPRAAH